MSYLKKLIGVSEVSNESLMNPNKNPIVKFLRRLHILGDGSNLGKLNQFSHMTVDGRITVLNDHQEKYGKNEPAEEVSADKLYTHLIYDGNQLKTNDEIVKAIYSCNKDTSDLYIKIPKFVDVLKQNKLDRLSNNLSNNDFENIAKKIKSLMEKHFGINLLKQFTFKGNPKEIDKIEALQDFVKPVNQLKRNMGIDLGRMYGQAKLLGKNKAIDERVRKIVSEILLAIVNKYYTFYVHVFHWMIRSFEASAKISNESFVESLGIDEFTLLESRVNQIADTIKEIPTHQIIDESQDDEANVYIERVDDNGETKDTDKLVQHDGKSFKEFEIENKDSEAYSNESISNLFTNLYSLSLEEDKEEADEEPPSEEESTDEDSDTDKEEKDEETDSEDTSVDDASEDETETADPEEDTESTEEDDADTEDEDTEETDEESTEESEERREEVELDDPDLEKSKIKEYLEPILGEEKINQLRLYSAGEVNRPLYHISMNANIKTFTPKISKRTLSKEDRSVPRISTSTSLVGCLNGYQSVVSDMDGRATKNFDGMFTVYELPYQYAIKPSKYLLQDVEVSDEYWLVSWKKETYMTIPKVVATFTVPKIEKVYGSDGIDHTWYIYAKVKQGVLYIDHERKLNEGYYRIILKGYNFKYPLKNNSLIKVETISENEYNHVSSLSMMIKKR